jgi:dipeptidyl-peptidase-4
MTVSFPRLAARTGRFTFGIPRNISVSPDGSKVWYIRTADGVTRTGQLWEHDVATGAETVIVDPATVQGDTGEELSDEERSRRERSRESGTGLVDFSVDDTGRWATFALSGSAWAVHLAGRAVTQLPTVGAVIDPRVDPTGRHVAYASGGALRVMGITGRDERVLVEPESPTEVWGRAEFIAAEELDRFRGFWWSPDGGSLLAERYDEAPVHVWHVADPEHPDREPAAQRYPAAGTPNAIVTLWHVGLDGSRTEVVWDRHAFEYLASVTWTAHGDPVLQVMSRDQRRGQVLSVDVGTGTTTVVRDLVDDDWVEVTSPPRYAEGGRLVMLEDVDGMRRVVVDGDPISDLTWQVRSIVSTHPDSVIATASQEPTEVQVVRFGLDGTAEPITTGAAVHSAVVGGPTTVVTRSALDHPTTTVTVHRDEARQITVASEPPPFEPGVTLLHAGSHALRTAVLFPRDHALGSRRLPVLMDPYGGPHAQRVLASSRMFLQAQWMADQGFCVVIADGRGTPGRGHAWERAVHHDLAGVTLDDQIAALDAVAEQFPDDVDTSRVGITGWSYGGYLAALAVLRRPDVFHVAVAGAPVTEWRLYDTAYTERYLGDPNEHPDVYDRNSLLPLAEKLERPLLLIHGLADDNVFAAHTLQLSSALLAAGRAHSVLPLSGVTHMTSHEVVAENLAMIQVEFLWRHLHGR